MKEHKQNAGFSSFSKKNQKNIEIKLVYCDEYFCIINKPAGIASQPARTGQNNVLDILSAQLNKPVKSLFPVNRLDQPVSGLMIIAFAGNIQAKFDQLRQSRKISKKYLAVTTFPPAAESGECKDYLLRDGKTNISSVVTKKTSGSKFAHLKWHYLAKADKDSFYSGENISPALLEIELITGRHHQIRVQLSHAGMPIWNDRKYGHTDKGDILKGTNIALLSRKLDFDHPVTGKRLCFELSLPEIYPYSFFSKMNS